ncbi:MAG: multiheme c-type cytochrome [Planctomycetota bacterium]
MADSTMNPILRFLIGAALLPLLCSAQAPMPCDIAFAKRAPRVVSFEMPISFAPGGNLFLRRINGDVINLTRLERGDVASPCVSFDGKRLLFAMKHSDRDPWRIMEMELASRTLRQISMGPSNDISPCYLPNGDIVFCSDRAGILDEYGRGPVFMLHRMGTDGENVRQISFNMSHDFDPAIAPDGSLVFGRWLNMPGAHLFPLFGANPDGSGMFSLYIDRSDYFHRLARPVPMPDGRVLVIAIPRGSSCGAGRLAVIDRRAAVEPGYSSAKRTDITPSDLLVRSVGVLPSGRLLLSCSPSVEGPPDFGLWLMDADGSGRALLYNDPEFWDEAPVPLVARRPPMRQAERWNPSAADAVISALNVYDNTGVRASLRCDMDLVNRRGSAERVRAVEGLAEVGADAEPLVSVRSRIKGKDRWRILAEAPVAPDGSFAMKLPAGKPLRFQTLSPTGRALTEEMNWVYALPGETLLCLGCHAAVNQSPERRPVPIAECGLRIAEFKSQIREQQISQSRMDDCGECHPGIYIKRWERNAHATSHRNPRFLNFYNGTDAKGNSGVEPGYKLDFPKTRGVCTACHAPNSAVSNPWGTDPAETDEKTGGVHCVVCHRTSGVDLTGIGSQPGIIGMAFRQPGTSKEFHMGPYDDVHSARDVYMPVHARSEFCAPCHEAKFWGTPIYATYSEYLATREAKQGMRCQDCHMPSEGMMPPPAKDGEVQRAMPPILPVHENREHEDRLLRNAARLEVNAKLDGKKVYVTVSVTNETGGHHLPTGHDMRNIVLRVEAAAAGKPMRQIAGERIPAWGGTGDPADGNYAGLPGKIFAKVLCDELENFPAPSWRRCTVLSDNRIAAHETDTSLYEFERPDGAAVTVKAMLIYRRFFKPIIAAKGWDLSDAVIASREITME